MSRLLEPKIVKSKTIRISEEMYEYLSKQGTFQDSFDSVIRKLIKYEKEE